MQSELRSMPRRKNFRRNKMLRLGCSLPQHTPRPTLASRENLFAWNRMRAFLIALNRVLTRTIPTMFSMSVSNQRDGGLMMTSMVTSGSQVKLRWTKTGDRIQTDIGLTQIEAGPGYQTRILDGPPTTMGGGQG